MKAVALLLLGVLGTAMAARTLEEAGYPVLDEYSREWRPEVGPRDQSGRRSERGEGSAVQAGMQGGRSAGSGTARWQTISLGPEGACITRPLWSRWGR